MQLTDLAFGQGDNRHLSKDHPLEEAGRVLLVAADAIERLRVDQI
ncbi:MAG: hypothetical protein WBD84_09335 [Methyloceanibacter sp.]